MGFQRVCIMVLDSVGIGEMPDAAQFGDSGAHTLGHIAAYNPGFVLPHMKKLGLGNIASLRGIEAVEQPIAYYGKMAEASVGKDTMTGHWEITGLRVSVPFRTFPSGFPAELIERFEQETGRRVIGNKPASGTEILDELGERQLSTGEWIVYTSADSVFQVAAHEGVIPLEELYRGCEIARRLTLEEPYAVGRVIARPYTGIPGAFKRTSNRHDYAVKPPEPTLLNHLQEAGLDCIGIGKIHDIFSGEGITRTRSTTSNLDGIQATIEQLKQPFHGLLFTNLVDFDSLYGHRRDPFGYGEALKQFDEWLPRILEQIGPDDLLILTADHGNDPTHAGTDHTREYVPLLVYSPRLKQAQSLGIRDSFADIGASVADNFGVRTTGNGVSFLQQLH